MRALILSDIHANWPALQSINEKVDRVIFAGDAVNYGPEPGNCVEWVLKHATYAVSGNHDSAISHGTDPHCSAPYREAASLVAKIHAKRLSAAHTWFLSGLPLRQYANFGGACFEVVHSSPKEPLYGYHTVEELTSILEHIDVDVLVVGHTHLPCITRVGLKLLINPGSVGQPKDGDPRASYAIWEDGHAEIRRVEYPIDRTIEGLRELDLPAHVFEQLRSTLILGRDPARPVIA